MKAKIKFSIKRKVEADKFPRLDFSKSSIPLNWGMKKGRKGNCIFTLPEPNCCLYALNPSILSYHNNNFDYLSEANIFSLIKEGYEVAKKIARSIDLNFEDGISFSLDGNNIEHLFPQLKNDLEHIGEKLFSTYKVVTINKSRDSYHGIITPQPKKFCIDIVYH